MRVWIDVSDDEMKRGGAERSGEERVSVHYNNVSHSVLRWAGGMERDNGGCLQEIAQT